MGSLPRPVSFHTHPLGEIVYVQTLDKNGVEWSEEVRKDRLVNRVGVLNECPGVKYRSKWDDIFQSRVTELNRSLNTDFTSETRTHSRKTNRVSERKRKLG